MHGRRSDLADPGVGSCACAAAWSSRYGHAYNQEAFRYFLAVERARLSRSGRSFVLLLARARRRDGGHGSMERALVRQVFATLQRTLRETDVLGWYRQDRVAAVILTDLGDALVSEVPRIIHQRVMAALPAAPATHLRVSVYAVLRAPGAVGELVMRGVRC